MKRTGYIFEKICDIDNIRLAMQQASLGKRKQNRVKKILQNIDMYAHRVRRMLIEKTYVPSTPVVKIIQDKSNNKTRTISKPNFFPDQIIHWALILQLEPIIMKGMYAHNCGSVPGRGTKHGQNSIRKWLDKEPRKAKYCLKMDIKKYYPSIDNELLKDMWRRKIKDPQCLWLIDTIIDSNHGQPIGFYTSQWFANFFLEGLDHYIKEQLGAPYYIRYVDDLVILGPNKKKLHKIRSKVEEYLEHLNLRLKENWQVFRTSDRPIDFLGYKYYIDRTILRKRTALRIRRRVSKIRRKGFLNESDASALISYWGWLKRSDSYYFYHKNIKPIVSIKDARKVVSINAKIRSHQGREAHYQLQLSGWI